MAFCHANVVFVGVIKYSLDEFVSISSLVTNSEKSHFFCQGLVKIMCRYSLL